MGVLTRRTSSVGIGIAAHQPSTGLVSFLVTEERRPALGEDDRLEGEVAATDAQRELEDWQRLAASEDLVRRPDASEPVDPPEPSTGGKAETPNLLDRATARRLESALERRHERPTVAGHRLGAYCEALVRGLARDAERHADLGPRVAVVTALIDEMTEHRIARPLERRRQLDGRRQAAEWVTSGTDACDESDQLVHISGGNASIVS